MKTRIKRLTTCLPARQVTLLTMPGFARACSMLCIGITLLTINPCLAQNGDPPPPPGEHGQNGNQPPGGGAPITGGIGILLAMGAAYSGKKVWYFHLADRRVRKRKPAN
jgi:hypothetical protein